MGYDYYESASQFLEQSVNSGENRVTDGEMNNDPVVVDDIAYVRVRTVTDSAIDFSSIDFGDGPLGIDFFSTEVDYLMILPEPATAALFVAGAVAGFGGRSRKRSR